MLDKSLIPTPLVDPRTRPPIQIVPVPSPRRFVLLHFLAALARWWLGGLWLRLRGKYTPEVAGRRLRAYFEHMGPFWIKLGQILSLRSDFFPPEYCNELAKLQYEALGFPPEVAHDVIEKELGTPLRHYFAEFEERPFAAASIAQVHRARLRLTGTEVVVKVQRPDVQWRYAQDMGLLRRLVGWLKRFKVMPALRWDEMLWELERIVQEETDYRYEASNLRRMRKSLRSHKVYVPRVFERCSTSRVVVMEHVPGVMMVDYVAARDSDPGRLQLWLRENNVDPQKVGERLALSYLRQVLEDNLVHGDLHPGNILLLRDSRFALIDLGSVGSLGQEMFQRYQMLNRAMALREYYKAADLTLLMCPDLPPINLAPIREAMVRAYRSWEARSVLRRLPYEEKSLGSLGADVARVMLENGIGGSWDFMKIGRTWTVLDASLKALVPDVDFGKVLRKHIRLAALRAMRKGRGKRLAGVLEGLRSLKEVLNQFAEQALYQGSVIRRQALIFQGVTTKLSFFFATMFRTCKILVGVFFLLMLYDFLDAHHPPVLRFVPRLRVLELFAESIPDYEYEVGIVIFLALFFFFLLLRRLQKRFDRPDVRPPDPTGRP